MGTIYTIRSTADIAFSIPNTEPCEAKKNILEQPDIAKTIYEIEESGINVVTELILGSNRLETKTRPFDPQRDVRPQVDSEVCVEKLICTTHAFCSIDTEDDAFQDKIRRNRQHVGEMDSLCFF